MDNQEIKLTEFKDQFVVLIKSSNEEKLSKMSEILSEMKNYEHTALVILNDFENPKILESSIYDHAYFVISKSKSTLLEGNVYLLYPDD